MMAKTFYFFGCICDIMCIFIFILGVYVFLLFGISTESHDLIPTLEIYHQEIYIYDYENKDVRKLVRDEIIETGKWGKWREVYCQEPDGQIHIEEMRGWPKPISEQDIKKLLGKRAFDWFTLHDRASATKWYDFADTGYIGRGKQGKVPWIVDCPDTFLGYTEDGVMIIGPSRTIYLEQ